MTINLSVPVTHELKPRITVIGVGGAGGNAVNNMITSHLEGVEFVVANTDAQALAQSLTERRIQLGAHITSGLGAGSRPDVGKAAAEEVLEEILDQLEGSNMAFIAAGMGGGTGTGAAPVIARAARENGILTVGVVTKPFQFEGLQRMHVAEQGIEELQEFVDTLIVIPNQNLFRVANEKTTFADAFKMADDVLHAGVRGVTDLMVMPGLINLDFADVRSVMGEMGKAMMGTGEAEGENRALESAEAAINNPLLDDVSMKGARGVLINVTTGQDVTLFEVDEAVNRIRDEVDDDANIIFGSTFDESLSGHLRVSVVATGIDAMADARPRPSFETGPRLVSIESAESVAPESPAAPPAETVAETIEAAEAPVFQSAADGTDEPLELEPVMEAPAIEPEPDSAEMLAAEAVAPQRPAEPAVQPAPAASLPAEPRVTQAPSSAPKADTRPATPVSAPVKGETRVEPTLSRKAEDAFIPPAPTKAPPSRDALRRPDPFAEAALTNAGGEPAKAEVKTGTGRGPSLFERITGGGRAKAEDKSAARPAPAPAKAEAKVEAKAAAQTTLKDMDSAPAPANTSVEEDFLDIPAFLRRQAN
jgi:cell division protein FtsZ